MSFRKQPFAALLLGALLLGAPAQAAKLGPFFPLPGNFTLSGNTPKDSLLKLQATWLQNGLDNLEKAKKETSAALEKAKAENAKPEQLAGLEGKLKGVEADIAATKEEIELGDDSAGGFERQTERKRNLLMNVNQWIRELSRQATQALKEAILKDGMEAQVAQNQHYSLTEQSDALERAEHDVSVEQWAVSR